MPQIFIWKYQTPFEGSYFHINSTNITEHYRDRIKFNSIPNFPVFNEELVSEIDAFEYKTGDFDINISLLQTERSLSGRTIVDFFDLVEDAFYVVVIYFNQNRQIVGKILPNSIIINDTITQNKYHLSFTVIGLIEDVKKFYASKSYSDTMEKVTGQFDDFWKEFGHIGGLQLQLKNDLRINDKIGFWPNIHAGLHYNLVHGGAYNYWEIFESLAKEIGFVFKLTSYEVNLYGYQAPPFRLDLLWRSTGIGDSTTYSSLKIMERSKEAYRAKPLPYIFFRTIYVTQGTVADEVYGLLTDGFNYTNLDVLVNQKEIFQENDDKVQISTGYLPFKGNQISQVITKDKIQIPKFRYYENFRRLIPPFQNVRYAINGVRPLSMIFSRIFCRVVTGMGGIGMSEGSDIGYKDFLLGTTYKEYSFLFSNLKRIQKLKIFYDENSTIGVGTQIIDQQPKLKFKYFCERIRDVDLRNKVANIDLVETV